MCLKKKLDSEIFDSAAGGGFPAGVVVVLVLGGAVRAPVGGLYAVVFLPRRADQRLLKEADEAAAKLFLTKNPCRCSVYGCHATGAG